MEYDLLQNPIIFIGVPRSGTSVISEIIFRHKELAFPSQYQQRHTSNTSVNFLRRVFDNDFWRIHGQKKQLNKVTIFNKYIFRATEAYPMWDAITPPEINFSRSFLLNTRADQKSKNEIRKYFKELVRKQGKKRLAFKLTGPGRLEYLNSIFPDAQYVRILRDPYATINSLLNVEFWKASSSAAPWWSGAYSKAELNLINKFQDNEIALTAIQVKKIIDTTEMEIDKLKLAPLTIKYKDFVVKPENIIQEILKYTNLSPDTSCMNYLNENKIYHRNKSKNEYFSNSEIQLIEKFL